jgi:hypothetical protein
MMSLCLAVAAIVMTKAATENPVKLPVQAFTLAWTHSIEKIRWEEDYRIEGHRLRLVEARIRGSGAGMEPPDGAVLRQGVWHYRPALAPVEQLDLARSGFVEDYTLCWEGRCHPMQELIGSTQEAPRIVIKPCP